MRTFISKPIKPVRNKIREQHMKEFENEFRVLIVRGGRPGLSLNNELLEDMFPNLIIEEFKGISQTRFSSSFQKCSFDVILFEIANSEKPKLQFIKDILFVAPSCPVIIVTAPFEQVNCSNLISLGVSDCLDSNALTPLALYYSIVGSIERKKNLLELLASERRYSEIFISSPQPMYIYDPLTFQFIQVNKAACEFYEYDQVEFLQLTTRDIIFQDDILKFNPNSAQYALKDEGITKGKFVHCKKSGKRIEVELYSTPILLHHKVLRSVIAFDVTEKNFYERRHIKAIINTQENERYEIGGELHDNVCQILAASQVTLGMLKENLVPSNLTLFNKCADSIKLALSEVRNLSHRLAPSFFDNSTLEDAFKRLFETFHFDEKLNVHLHFDATVKNLFIELEVRLNLYRILQEQIGNILKYANASLVHVYVVVKNKFLRMRIIDNGAGFDLQTKQWGIGLSNMKRRAELFSGTFEITSSFGNGCEVIINIPLTEIA